MRILLIEDNHQFSLVLQGALIKDCPSITIDAVESKFQAEQSIDSNFYDLIILDLCIPSNEGKLDKDVAHGQSVFYSAQLSCPGTPIYILTGSEPDVFCLGLSRHGQKINLWGGEAFPTVLYFPKDQTDKLLSDVKKICVETLALNEITINTRGKKIPLEFEKRRALQIFTRRYQGASSSFVQLGGLSGSIVGRLTIFDHSGNVLTVCVAKVGPRNKVKKESEAYERHVKLMKMHAFAPLLDVLDYGLRKDAAIFYSLADGYDLKLFDVLQSDELVDADIISKVKAGLERWSSAKSLSRVSIKQIRQTVLSDENLDELRKKYSIDFSDEVEKIFVRASTSCIHGDLHGGNVLVNQLGNPVFIDFGDVGPGYTCLDPITLEMSLLFHPDAISRGLSGEFENFVHLWPDVDDYASNLRLSKAVHACREWAYDVGGDDNAVLAAGYCFALRQLKYQSMDSTVTLTLLANISKRLLEH